MEQPLFGQQNDVEVVAALGMFLLSALLIYTVLYTIPLLVVLWKLFTKAEQPGWAAIVPVYNIYVANEVARLQVLWFVLSLFVPFASLYVLYKLVESYGKGTGSFLLLIFFPIVTVFTVNKWQYQSAGVAGEMPQQPMQQPVQTVVQGDPSVAPEAPQPPVQAPTLQPTHNDQPVQPVSTPVQSMEPVTPVQQQPNPFQPAQPRQPTQPEESQNVAGDAESNRDQTPPQGPTIQ